MITFIRKLLKLGKVTKKASRGELEDALFSLQARDVLVTLGVSFKSRTWWMPPTPRLSVEDLKVKFNLKLVNYTEAFLEVGYIKQQFDTGDMFACEKRALVISDHIILQEDSGVVRGNK